MPSLPLSHKTATPPPLTLTPYSTPTHNNPVHTQRLLPPVKQLTAVWSSESLAVPLERKEKQSHLSLIPSLSLPDLVSLTRTRLLHLPSLWGEELVVLLLGMSHWPFFPGGEGILRGESIGQDASCLRWVFKSQDHLSQMGRFAYIQLCSPTVY